MKKVLILIFSIFIIYGCKSYSSDVSSLIETDGVHTYLFGASFAKDGSSIICRFSCSSVPSQDNKDTLCQSPVYIEESVLKNSGELSKFLEDIIDSKELYTREISTSEKDKLSSLFNAEASRASRGVYNSRLGQADSVCSSVIDTNNKDKTLATQVSFKKRQNVRLIDLISCDIIAESVDHTLFLIPKSFDECINQELLDDAGLRLEYKAFKKLSDEVYTIDDQEFVINYSEKFQKLKSAFLTGKSSKENFSSYNFVYYTTNYQDGPYIHSPIKDAFLLMVCSFDQDFTKVHAPRCYRYLYNF